MMFVKSVLYACVIVWLSTCFSIHEHSYWKNLLTYPGCMQQGGEYGVFPKDPYFLENQALVIECFTDKKFKNLTFLVGLETYGDRYVWKNETYARLRIPNITAAHIGKMNNALVKCQDADTCIDNAIIQLDYYPQEPGDINCVVDNFETLLCTWDLVVKYKHTQYVSVKCQYVFNVSTKYKLDPNASGWGDCPNGTDTSCFWDSNNYHNSVLIFLNVSVTNTKMNITCDKLVRIERDDVLKPGKVTNLTVRDMEDPTCVEIMWEPPKTHRNFTYNITYSSRCQDSDITVHHACDGFWCEYKLCRLNPFTLYRLDIVSRYSPSWTERGYWSDVTTTTFRTNKTAPSRNPVSSEGLYIYNHPFLTLFWLPLGLCDLHSDDTVYELLFPNTNKIVLGSEFKLETKLQLPNTSSDHFYVSMRAQNSQGAVPDQLVMKIFGEKYGPPDSELIIEYVDNNTDCKQYMATIRVDPHTTTNYTDITHTIIWCHIQTGATNICTEPWYIMENVTEVRDLSIAVEDCNGTFKFGLITKGRHKHYGHTTWTDIHTINCIYPYNTAPTEPLPNVRLSTIMLPNTVTVEWEPYPCNGEEPVGYIHNYIVIYCVTREPDTYETCDCIKQREVISVQNDRLSYTVEDLESYLPVCVWVAANTSAGTGPSNIQALFYIVGHDESSIHPLMIIIPGVGTIAIIVLIVVSVRTCKTRIKKWLQELRTVDDPLMPLQAPDHAEPMGEDKVPHLPNVNADLHDSLIGFETDDETDYENDDNDDDEEEVIDGYFATKDLAGSSYSSVNSALSQHDGTVFVKGIKMEVQHRAKLSNSTIYLCNDAEILTRSENNNSIDDEPEMSTNNSVTTLNERQQEQDRGINEFLLRAANRTIMINVMNNLNSDVQNVTEAGVTSEQTVPKLVCNPDNAENEGESIGLLNDDSRKESYDIRTIAINKLSSLVEFYKTDSPDSDSDIDEHRALLEKKNLETHDIHMKILEKDSVSSSTNSVIDMRQNITADSFAETNEPTLSNSGLSGYAPNECMDGYTPQTFISASNKHESTSFASLEKLHFSTVQGQHSDGLDPRSYSTERSESLCEGDKSDQGQPTSDASIGLDNRDSTVNNTENKHHNDDQSNQSSMRIPDSENNFLLESLSSRGINSTNFTKKYSEKGESYHDDKVKNESSLWNPSGAPVFNSSSCHPDCVRAEPKQDGLQIDFSDQNDGYLGEDTLANVSDDLQITSTPTLLKTLDTHISQPTTLQHDDSSNTEIPHRQHDTTLTVSENISPDLSKVNVDVRLKYNNNASELSTGSSINNDLGKQNVPTARLKLDRFDLANKSSEAVIPSTPILLTNQRLELKQESDIGTGDKVEIIVGQVGVVENTEKESQGTEKVLDEKNASDGSFTNSSGSGSATTSSSVQSYLEVSESLEQSERSVNNGSVGDHMGEMSNNSSTYSDGSEMEKCSSSVPSDIEALDINK